MVDPEFITSLVVYAIAISAVAVYFPCTWYMIVYVWRDWGRSSDFVCNNYAGGMMTSICTEMRATAQSIRYCRTGCEHFEFTSHIYPYFIVSHLYLHCLMLFL